MGPLPDGIYRAEFPYLYRAPRGFTEDEAVEYYIGRFLAVFEEASPPENVAAVVLEPVQGEGGFIPAPKGWIQAIRKICDKHGILIIADEVQTGFCRSGRWFVSDYWTDWGCPPDIIAAAKSIAGGIPLGAVCAGASIVDKVPAGTIGGTYGGNALACASALKIIEIMERDKLAFCAEQIAEKVQATFKSWQKEYRAIGDVRGIGCMLGMEFVKDEQKTPWPEVVSAIVQEAAFHGLIVESAGTYGNVIRFLSPLVITEPQLDRGLEILKAAIAASLKKLS
jgi:4-aminobutyrate aminotransferase/(S)-3-amino-2-methylpropionate transaminase